MVTRPVGPGFLPALPRATVAAEGEVGSPPVDQVTLQGEASQVGRTRRTLGHLGKAVHYAGAALQTAVRIPGVLGGVGAALAMRSAGFSSTGLLQTMSARAPGTFRGLTNATLKLASGPIERSLGLSVEDLVGVERTLYQRLAPRMEYGRVRPSPIFERLARQGGLARPLCLVDLGPGRETDTAEINCLFPMVRDTPGNAPSELKPVWKSLFEQAERGQLPVFLDLDGDPGKITPTEAIANQTLASLGTRLNDLGDWFDTRTFYPWLNARMLAGAEALEPELARHNLPAAAAVHEVRRAVTPNWTAPGTNPENLLGWRCTPGKAAQAARTLQALADDDPAGFADAVVALDHSLVTGVQSHWIKLLRELEPAQRAPLLQRVAETWLDLNLNPGPARRLALPTYDQKDGQYKNRQYEPGAALGEVVDHTLNGLGIRERKNLISELRTLLEARQLSLTARDDRLRRTLDYPGVDVGALIQGRGCTEPQVRASLEGLAQVEHSLDSDAAITSPELADQLALVKRHRSLLNWLADLPLRYGEPLFALPRDSQRAVAVGEFLTGLPVAMAAQQDAPREPEVLGNPQGKPVKMSLVLEGGGGKGFCYVECLEQLKQALSDSQSRLELDEIVGTSAGAITAGLLAAGYRGDELKQVMEQLDFKTFNSDFLWLQGGYDPMVRGIDRTGLFSMQQMYQTLHHLLSCKLSLPELQGLPATRPITFRDLPCDLKVIGTVLNTDLPADDPLRDLIGPDGQIVFSRETTPDFDVVGCILASAAVPMFFNAPQLQIGRGDGGHYRMQLVDGGVVNNLPVAQAGRPEEASMLVMLPAYYEAPGAEPLSTLSFESKGVEPINAFNRERYQKLTRGLAETVDQAAATGMERVVVGLNLATTADQSAPVVQGRTRAASRQLVELAQKNGMPALEAGQAAKVVRSNLNTPGLASKALQYATNVLLDGHGEHDRFTPGLLGDRRYEPGENEATSMFEVLNSVVAARLSSESALAGKLFEQA